jgi:hypothetical protein
MGHARTQTVKVSGFDAVLGARRGSPSAQKQRDIAEERYREETVQDFLIRVSDLFDSTGVMIVDDMADALVLAYRERTPVAESAEMMLTKWLSTAKQAQSESKLGRSDTLHEIMTIAVVGDPRGWPGLTAPAVQALNHFFASSSVSVSPRKRGFARKVRSVAEALAVKREQAEFVITMLFGLQHEEGYYSRFTSLCEALALTIADLTVSAQAKADISRRVTLALSVAPESAVCACMRSWVDALAQLLDDGLPASEHELLQKLVRQYELGSEGANAFAPIAARL